MNSTFRFVRCSAVVGCVMGASALVADVPTRTWDFEDVTVDAAITSVACDSGVADEAFVRADGNRSTFLGSTDVPFATLWADVGHTVKAADNVRASVLGAAALNYNTLKISNVKSALGLADGSFTFEFFIKPERGLPQWTNVFDIRRAANDHYTMIMQVNTDNSLAKCRFVVRFDVEQTSGARDDGFNTCIRPDPIAYGEWSYVAIIYDETTHSVRFNVNGRMSDATTLKHPLVWDYDAAALNLLRNFKGGFDHLRITPRALADGELLCNFVDLPSDSVPKLGENGVAWRFEEGAVGEAANVNTASIDSVSWEIAAAGSYRYGQRTNDVPFAVGYAYADAFSPTPYRTIVNTQALAVTNQVNKDTVTYAMSGAAGELLDLSNKSFTVEVYVKPTRQTARWSKLARVLRKNGHNSFLMGLDNNGGKCYLSHYFDVERVETSTGGVDGYNTNVGGGKEIPLDAWSHVAIVYDNVTTNVYTYIDGTAVVTTKLLHPPLFDNPVAELELFAGYVGLFDEFKIIPRALAADELDCKAYDVKTPLTSPTRAWLRFEELTADATVTAATLPVSSANREWLAGGSVSGTPVCRTAAPTSKDVGFRRSEVADPSEMLEDDMQSVALAKGGRILYSASRALALGSFTAELFVKATDPSSLNNYPMFLKIGRPNWTYVNPETQKSTAMNDKSLIALALAKDTRLTRVLFDSCPRDVEPIVNVNWNQSLADTESIADGRWHHVAITYDRESNTISGYTDYRKWTKTAQPAYPLPTELCTLALSDVSSGQQGDWQISEVRISDKVLAPGEFLHEFKDGGVVLIVR